MSEIPPVRRYEMTLKLSADSVDELCRALDHISFDVDSSTTDGELPEGYSVVSGGYASGWIGNVKFHPDVTHDTWYEALQAHIKRTPADADSEGGAR